MKLTNLLLATFTLSVPFIMNANAQCGPSSMKPKANASVIQAAAKLKAPSAVPHATSSGSTSTSIVGLWDSTFTSDGQVVDEGIEQWHGDGTEILNDIPAPATGNVCLGVWSQVGQTIYLTHPFWIFDTNNVNLIGRGMIQQQVAVDASGNSYSGTFTIQFNDLMGNTLYPDAAGTISAVRISPVVPNVAPAITVTTAGGTTANANGLLQTPFSPLLLDASGSSGTGALTYEWSSSSPVQLATTKTPGQILVNFPAAGDYALSLKVTDAQGNTGTYSVTVEFTGRAY